MWCVPDFFLFGWSCLKEFSIGTVFSLSRGIPDLVVRWGFLAVFCQSSVV